MSQVTSGLKLEKIDGNYVIIRTQSTYDENNPDSTSSVTRLKFKLLLMKMITIVYHLIYKVVKEEVVSTL